MGEEDFRNFLQFCIRTSRGLRRKRIRRDAEGIIKDLKVELDELKSGKFVCKNRNIL